MADQLAQDPPAPREVPDRPPGRVVDSRGDESLELRALGVEDADGRIAGPGQLPSSVQHALEHRLAVELGDDRRADIKEQPQSPLVECATIHGPP